MEFILHNLHNSLQIEDELFIRCNELTNLIKHEDDPVVVLELLDHLVDAVKPLLLALHRIYLEIKVV